MHLSLVQVGQQERHTFKSIKTEGLHPGAPNRWTCDMAGTAIAALSPMTHAEVFCTTAMQAGCVKTTCLILVHLCGLHSCNCLLMITIC